MKKVAFLLSFFFVLGMAAVNAQSCCAGGAGKSCAAKVSKAASADPTIEKRQSDDGSVAYVRKEADAQGNVKFVSSLSARRELGITTTLFWGVLKRVLLQPICKIQPSVLLAFNLT